MTSFNWNKNKITHTKHTIFSIFRLNFLIFTSINIYDDTRYNYTFNFNYKID